jgi:DNA-binding winged helix-turn-helix (wHTH) protein/tetratricopeptide (TPR) repeat protein
VKLRLAALPESCARLIAAKKAASQSNYKKSFGRTVHRMQAVQDITFGRFRLDLTNECLWQGTRAISLRPKAFAVLKVLVERPGLLVTKQQVLDAVWPDTFVGDAVLKDSIRQLREALHDDAAQPLYIETAHRRGYRFIGKLSEPISTKTPAETTAASEPSFLVAIGSADAQEVLGREAELVEMNGWLEHALAGERQTVFVTGEAGIGKTTLVQAFLQQISRDSAILVARGQCLEHYGSGEAYLPVLDGFSRLCRSAAATQVLNCLRQHAPSWLAQMPSVIQPTERSALQLQAQGATRERMLREMAEAIEMLAGESPLLLVLEDLHWSDYSTLDLISYLARRQGRARLMVVGTYRPVDVIVGDHPLKGVKRELQAHNLCRELPLEYLAEEIVAEYLKTRFPGHQLPARLRRIIYQRTEGNPLFMVNLVEYLIHQKMIVEEKGAWNLRVELSDVEKEVPANLRQLIEKHIERLNPDQRMVLEAASVAGMECSTVAIAAGLENTVEWVEEHCEQLAGRHQFLSPGWLVELPDGTITPRHRFVHVLYRDVPYRMMAPMRRAQIHQRIAERGVAIYGDRAGEIAAELAMHFEQNHDWPRALEYLLQAAQNAATRSAHHEAIDLANRGLEALKQISETAERAKQEMKLRMILCASLMSTKGFASPEVEKINAPGRELFWRHGPSPELFYMLWSLNMYQQFSGNMGTSLEISQQVLQLAENLKDGALIMEGHRAMGAALVLSGRCSEALDHLQKGAELYPLYRDHSTKVFTGGFDNKVMVECFIALALLPLGYPEQSAERISGSLALARELDHPQTLVIAQHVAAQLHHLRGEPVQVQIFAKKAMDLADEYGMALWVIYGLIELGWADAELGDTEVGIEKMQEGLAQYEATGAKLRTPYFLALLSDQLNKAGRTGEGLAAIEKAIRLAKQTGEGFALSELHRIKGELFLNSANVRRSGNVAHQSSELSIQQARACFAESVGVSKQQGARYWELKAALSMYGLDVLLGNRNRKQIADIYSSFTEGFETADLKRAKALLEEVGKAST